MTPDDSTQRRPTSGVVFLSELSAYIDRLLDASVGQDYCPNGLQVEGRREIKKIATGVSACRELFDRAHKAGADAVLVHHGLFWSGAAPTLTGIQYRRVKDLVDSGMSLLAYHLPLDRDPKLGNNALGLKELGLAEPTPFGVFEGATIGSHGRYSEPLAATEFFDRCERVFGQAPLTFASGPDTITTVGLISGAAERALHEAIELDLDAFVTGEASEWVMNVAHEAGIHFVSAGHYATERLGIRALGAHLAEHFGIEAEFIDIPNPVEVLGGTPFGS